MATKHPTWNDEDWLLLMQLYMQKPVGVKPMFSRPMVDLALELHIHPQVLYEQMMKLRQIDTPRMERLWQQYGNSPRRLAKGVKMLRQMKGFRNANAFYDGVEETVAEWEADFMPLEGITMPQQQTATSSQKTTMMPVHLIMILDQYFRLTPTTMVASTPEVKTLARLLDIPAETVVEVMDVFQICDPYLKRDAMMVSEFLLPCRQIWQRFGNDKPEKLAALAAQLKAYFV